MKLRRSLAGVAAARLLATALTVATGLALATAVQAQPTTLQLKGSFIAEHATSRAMKTFKDEAERLSGGAFEIELTPGFNGLKALLDDIRTQNTFGIWIATSNLARLIPEISVLSLPFVFDNYDQLARALKGPAGTVVAAKLEAKGFILLGWMTYGEQNVANARRPLRTLADFKDLKLRVLPDEARLATLRALGASPVALDLKDLLPALQQGDIDGVENSYSVLYRYKLYEHEKYLSDTAHCLGLVALLVNKAAFTSLPAEQQKALRKAAAVTVAQQWKMGAAEEADTLVKLKEAGLQFDPLSRETRAAMRRATAGVIEDARKRFGAELMDSVLAARKSGDRLEH
jgi:tripartite ATP-independent transporter DctP family solute receptor